MTESAPSSPGVGGRIRLLAYPLFFASGMAGLTYEIVWTRMLLYSFGASLYAVTAVLAAFMAGLALGSALLGRAADRLRYPIRFYGILEFLIGAAGLLLPLALDQLPKLDGWAYGRFGQNFALLTALRFGAAFVLLLIPTTLMGATLPVLARAMVDARGGLGRHVGGLYAINTAGAVAGAFLAGFWFIERYGVRQTEMIAALLNFFSGLGALVISAVLTREYGAEPADREAPAAPPEQEPAPADGAPSPASWQIGAADARLVYFAAFATGIVSLGCQIVWSRSLVFHFEYLKNTTYAFSAMLTVFLTGIALGSAVIGPALDRAANPMRLYGILLAFLGVSIALSANVLHGGATWLVRLLGLPDPFDNSNQDFNWTLAVASVLAQSASVLAFPTFLMGMALPAATRAVASARRVGAEVGSVFALNTCGAILGSLVAAFILIPRAGLTGALLILAAVDGLLGLWILGRASSRELLIVGPIAAVLFGFAVTQSPPGRGMQEIFPGETLLHYEEGPLATVSVIQNSFGDNTIYVDGVGVAGTDPMLQTDQKSLAHMPMFLVKDPKRALTVGFGSGGASYSYLLHDRLEAVRCVEICKEVLNAAPHLTAANHGFGGRRDPRYEIILDDARAYLHHTADRYDVIATDCTDLRYKSNANLYDLEYFQFCRRVLNPGGIVVVWMPLGGLSLDVFKIALRTFHRVFPEMGVFYMSNEPTHYILLIGWQEKGPIDYRLFADRLAEPDVGADLAELDLADPAKLLSCWITGGEPLAQYLAGDGVNTEDRPLIEFASPKYGYQDQPVLDNLASLMEVRTSILDLIDPATIPAAEAERLKRYEQALEPILRGHAHYRKIEIEPATAAYLEAQKLAPEDKSVETLLGFPEIAAKAGLGDVWATIMLGRVNMLRGRNAEALAGLDRGLALMQQRGGPQNDFQKGVANNALAWREELRSAPPAP